MARTSFLLVVVDHNRGIFNVVGPIAHDATWNKRVVNCQEAGRDVRCFTAPEGRTKESIAAEYSTQAGYEYVEDSVLNLADT